MWPETEGLFKVIDNDVYCRCGNISKMVQDRDVVITDH